MGKNLLKGVAVMAAVAVAVPSVPLPAEAAVRLSVADCVISKGDKFDIDIEGAKEKAENIQHQRKAWQQLPRMVL